MASQEHSQPGDKAMNIDRRGFDCEFVEHPPKELQSECPVCLQIICDPYQVTCCGYSYCHSCIERIKADSKPCPTCNRKGFSDFPNKGLKRSLYAFKVRCSHQKYGCEWTGELGQLDVHLNKDPPPEKRFDGCPLTTISCDFHHLGCRVILYRKDASKHIREYLLTHMSLLASSHTHQHAQIAELIAENRSLRNKTINLGAASSRLQVEVNKLKENHTLLLASHTGLQTDCNELKTENERLNRELSRLSQEIKAKRAAPDTPTKVVRNTVISLVPSAVLIMTNFRQHKENKDDWNSPPVYTHHQGYKVCLRVRASGQLDGAETHVSVFVHFMRGEFDDFLEWPFRGVISFRLLDLSGVHDISHSNKYDNTMDDMYCGRVTVGGTARFGWGCPTLAAHTALKPKYLQNDSLQFQVYGGEAHFQD